MAGVKGKAGRKKRYVRLVGYVTPEQARFVLSFGAEQSEAVRQLISIAQQRGIDAQCADVSKQAA